MVQSQILMKNRQVGHYWLRNPSISPSTKIGEEISADINSISDFGKQILNGEIKNKNNQNYTDVLWIGIGGSGLGPLLITCLLYTSPSPRDSCASRMPSSA